MIKISVKRFVFKTSPTKIFLLGLSVITPDRDDVMSKVALAWEMPIYSAI